MATILLAGCTATPTPTSEVETGITKFLGQTEVVERTTEGADTSWTFGGPAGCLRGDPFRMGTRDRESEDLIVFLQGGGACWSDFCLAVTRAPEGVPRFDLIDPEIPDNPFASWNVAYLPYCDGSLFVGDAEHDDDGDGTADRFHHGLANLSAGLETAKESFPAPRRVLFAGSSGGGFGVSLAAPLVREVFPDAELILLADSATGVARGAAEPGFTRLLMEEFGSEPFLPEGCEDCLAGGHITPVIERTLSADPSVRMGVFSSWSDGVMADIFLDVDPEVFAGDVETETGALAVAYPEQYRRFVVHGTVHTTLLGDASGIIGSDITAVEIPPDALGALGNLRLGSLRTTETASGETFSSWLLGLVEDTPAWTDTLDPR